MTESISKADRDLFQKLIDRPLATTRDLREVIGRKIPASTIHYRIDAFCKQYKCSVRVQILDWSRIGLRSFFAYGTDLIEHPYAVRRLILLGPEREYLTQFVIPEKQTIPHQLRKSKASYELLKKDRREVDEINFIHRPTNSINLLYDEARTDSFNDRWLLNLKEVMVQGEMGDVAIPKDIRPMDAISVNVSFLNRLSKLYLKEDLGLFKFQTPQEFTAFQKFMKKFRGFLTPYLELSLPGMRSYLIELSQTTKDPLFFVGGLHGRFPLAELFESHQTLIVKLLTPVLGYSKFGLLLYNYLSDICTPYLWSIKEDKRMFRLVEQWDGDAWLKFEM